MPRTGPNLLARWAVTGAAAALCCLVTVILVLAVVITRLGKKIDEWRSWGMLIVLIAPLALMVMANNLSSGLIIVGIGFVMMFIACKKKWIFILSMALGAAVFIFAPMIAMGLEKAGILEEIFQGYEEKKQAAEGIVTAVLRYTT